MTGETRCWLIAPASNVAHVAKAGMVAVYGIGRVPNRPDPELRDTLCGVRPDWWAIASVDPLLAFEDEPPRLMCAACCKVAGIPVVGQQSLAVGV